MKTATQAELKTFQQIQAAHLQKLTRALDAANSLLNALTIGNIISHQDFLNHLRKAVNADNLTAQEILYHLQHQSRLEEHNITDNTATYTFTIANRHPATPDGLIKTADAFINRYPCLCCRNYTMENPRHGTYDICDVCYWEDDPTQVADPNRFGGANPPSLNHARLNYQRHGACEERMQLYVRAPHPAEQPQYRHLITPDLQTKA